ncbi:MAG TPA: alpha-amylase family glycosyl hydrolase, partial [Egibacteraceae bacterium]|nr:alpha-amylase family glycosyl hydrolase [Egibacteraceae bacterium]
MTLQSDPEWYRTTIIYEVNVRGFSDSNNDGTGDIRGLIERLDYLQWLGIDCIWLLPFYASPLQVVQALDEPADVAGPVVVGV